MSTYYAQSDQYCAGSTTIWDIPSITGIPNITSTTTGTTVTSTVAAGKNGTSTSGTGVGATATANASASKGAADGGFDRDSVPVVVSGVLAGIVALVGFLL
jgi:hypothetical protein